MFYLQALPSLYTFQMFKHILIFQKKLKVKVLCQFAKALLYTLKSQCANLKHFGYLILYILIY
jgi:hypothetical protein